MPSRHRRKPLSSGCLRSANANRAARWRTLARSRAAPPRRLRGSAARLSSGSACSCRHLSLRHGQSLTKSFRAATEVPCHAPQCPVRGKPLPRCGQRKKQQRSTYCKHDSYNRDKFGLVHACGDAVQVLGCEPATESSSRSQRHATERETTNMAMRDAMLRSVEQPATEPNAGDAMHGAKSGGPALAVVNRAIRVLFVAWLIVTTMILWWMR